jgi:hypothetical protein
MLKIKSTYIPEERLTAPQSNPNMVYVYDYWTQPYSKFNEALYLNVVRAKKGFINSEKQK